MLRAQWVSVNIMPSFLNPWEVAHNLTKATSRQTSTLLSKFCTVHGTGEPVRFTEYGDSAFWLYTNIKFYAFGNRTWPLFRGVHKVGYHYSMWTYTFNQWSVGVFIVRVCTCRNWQRLASPVHINTAYASCTFIWWIKGWCRPFSYVMYNNDIFITWCLILG